MRIYRPILLDLPIEMKSNRLSMRIVRSGDGKMINEAVRESFENLNKWFDWASVVPSVDDTEEVVRKISAQFILRERITFIFMNDKKLLGMCGVERTNWDIPSGELGYWCRSSEHGKGYTTEAVTMVSEYAFKNLKLNRLTIITLEKNKASCRVAEKAGYILETKAKGVIKNPHTTNLENGCIYSKINLN